MIGAGALNLSDGEFRIEPNSFSIFDQKLNLSFEVIVAPVESDPPFAPSPSAAAESPYPPSCGCGR
jgi:hypothetical protein